jgi:3-oxoacyl-[acyl-carrier-protein] synthase-3
MRTKIEMVTVSRPLFRFSSRGSIYLSASAAKQCIVNTGINPCEIGLLINTGIYRFKNTGEPAIAAMIQNSIGAKSTRRFAGKKNPSDCKTTFSFDLNNGGCGWLTGIQIINGFIQTGGINYGMVVTGDSEPFPGLSEDFNFESAAAAIILSKSEDSIGFSLFRSYEFPEYKKEFISNTYHGKLKGRRGKRNILSVRQKETYLDLCVDCAIDSVNKFLNEAGIALSETDLIIPSQSPAGFAQRMKNRIGMNDNFVEIASVGKKELHTAGPAIALKKTWDDKRFHTSKNILFLTVSSGITVSIALYNN